MGIDASRKHGKSISNSFKVGDVTVRVSADPPHLLKNIRNALQKSDFVLSQETVEKYKLKSNIVSLQHIRKLYEFDSARELKYAPRLTQDCFDVTGLNRMNVPLAKRLLSQEVGAGLQALVENFDYPQEYLTTAFFCTYIGKWYNLITSRSSKLAFSLHDFRRYEEEMEFLDEMIDIIDGAKLSASQQFERIPIQKGFILSTISLKEIVDFLLRHRGYRYVMCGRFTGDCVENFFSCVRRHQKAPTCMIFVSIIKILTIITFLRPSKHGSYEEDELDEPDDDVNPWLKEVKDFEEEPEEQSEAEKEANEIEVNL